jgi:DNA-binding PadR family transcriptional regulator
MIKIQSRRTLVGKVNRAFYSYSESDFTLSLLCPSAMQHHSKVSSLENNPDPQLEKNIVEVMYERFLKEFIDVLIMVKLSEEGEASGYDLLSYFHRKFDLLVSPGTVYAMLYSMERNDIVKARGDNRKRIYSLTPKGKSTIQAISEASDDLGRFFPSILKDKHVKAKRVVA